jgi:hypothetical protein
MTSSRARAYRRVVKTLEDLGPTKLRPSERDRVREIADTLVFCADPTAEGALLACLEAESLVRHLTQSGRWTAERAERLHADLRACGPGALADAVPRAA